MKSIKLVCSTHPIPEVISSLALLGIALVLASCGSQEKLAQEAADRAAAKTAANVQVQVFTAGKPPKTQDVKQCTTIKITYNSSTDSVSVDPEFCFAKPKDTIAWTASGGVSDFAADFEGPGSPFSDGSTHVDKAGFKKTVTNPGKLKLHHYVVVYMGKVVDPHVIIMGGG